MGKLLDPTKPFATVFFATDAQASAINPNGWLLHDPTYNVAADPANFRTRMLSLANQAKNGCLAMGADVAFLWDLPFGQRLPHVWTYYGDPTVWQSICPELTMVTGGKTLLTELLEVFTSAGLQIAWTLRPQRALVQASGDPPSDTTIDWVLILDKPWGQQLYHYNGSAWVVASAGTTGYGQHQPYGTSFAEGELTRKMNYVRANFPQVWGFYIDTTVDPDGTALGDIDANLWKRLKTAFPEFVFCQEQESINDSVYYSGNTPSSAGYGQANQWASGPPQRESDMRANAQRLISMASTNSGDPSRYSVMRPWLVESVARGRTKVGGRWEMDPADTNGDTYIINDILTAAASWTPPAANPWTSISTNDLAAWIIEGFQGTSYISSVSQGSIVGGALRITSGVFPWARGWRRIGDLTPGEQRALQYTVASPTSIATVQIEKPDGTLLYDSGLKANGTYTATVTVPAGVDALYFYFYANDYTGTADLSNVSFGVAAAVDTTPNAYGVPNVTGAALSTLYVSDPVTITGINAPASVSITGGEYRVNGGAWTSGAGTVNNNDVFQRRGTSSGSYSTAANVVSNIGGVSNTWTITTAAAPGGGGALIYSQPFSGTVADLVADGWAFVGYTGSGDEFTLTGTGLTDRVSIVSGALHMTSGDGVFWTTARRVVTGLTAGQTAPVGVDYSGSDMGVLRVFDGTTDAATRLVNVVATSSGRLSSTFSPTGTSVLVVLGLGNFDAVTFDNLSVGASSDDGDGGGGGGGPAPSGHNPPPLQAGFLAHVI